MPTRREAIRSDDDLLVEGVREIAAAVGPIVTRLAIARANFIVADEIERRDLVERATVTDQVTATELLREILHRLEAHASTPGATATGAHDLARRVGRSLGVAGAASLRAFRRTRAEIDLDPSPTRKREGTRGLVGGVHRGEVYGRW